MWKFVTFVIVFNCLTSGILTYTALNPVPFAVKNRHEIIKEKVLHFESGAKHRDSEGEVKVSPKKAVGKYQVTAIALKQMNWRYGWEYSYADLWDERINEKVGDAYYEWLCRIYKRDYIKVLNAYNMGMGYTDGLDRKGKPKVKKYNAFYLRSIIPEEYRRWKTTVSITNIEIRKYRYQGKVYTYSEVWWIK